MSINSSCDTGCIHFTDEKWCSHGLATSTFISNVNVYVSQISSLEFSLNRIASSHTNPNNGKKSSPRNSVRPYSSTSATPEKRNLNKENSISSNKKSLRVVFR